MELRKKELIISFIYIISNILFHRSIFKDYPNIVLFLISTFLCIAEILFWNMQFKMVNNLSVIKNTETKDTKDTKTKDSEAKDYTKRLFMIGLSGVGISRIFLYSSPYLNDLIINNTMLIYIVGIFHILFIFATVMLIFYIKDSNNKLFIINAVLNLIVAAMIWLDFDNNVTALLRIIIGVVTVVIIMSKLNRKFEES